MDEPYPVATMVLMAVITASVIICVVVPGKIADQLRIDNYKGFYGALFIVIRAVVFLVVWVSLEVLVGRRIA